MAALNVKDGRTGETYRLEYDRDSVVYAEKLGFNVTEAASAYATDMVTLFRAAFHKNHRNVPVATIDDLWDHMPNKGEVFMKLFEMFMEPYNALLAEPKKGDAKNAVTFELVD